MLLALLLLISQSHASPRVESPDAVGLEALGRSILYGVFYDRSSGDWAVGGGIARIETNNGSSSALVPLYANYYFSSFFATGGLNLLTSSLNNETPVLGNTRFLGVPFYPVFGVGYEIRQQEGFLFRANAYVSVSRTIAPSAGFGLGYVF